MKRILLLILGYWLGFQCFISTLGICGTPEQAPLHLFVAGVSGWGSYALIHYARNIKPVDTPEE